MPKLTSVFLYCEKCGKKLIERRQDGMFIFKFGKNNESNRIPVEIHIYGSIKMICIRGTCRHPNVFNYFPDAIDIDESVLPNVIQSGSEIELREIPE